MMNRATQYFFIFLFLCALGSCSLTKYVPKGDALYTGSQIKMEDSTLSAKEKKALIKTTQTLPRPLPNRNFLGLPLRLMLYNMGGDPEKGGFIRRFFHKIGDPPILLSSFHLDYNEKLLQNFLENNGYFSASVSGDTVIKRQKANAVFTLTPHQVYTIGSLSYDVDSTISLGKAIRKTGRRALIKPGSHYSLTTARNERERINTILKQRGYFYFTPDFLIFNADSTIGSHRVDMHLSLKENVPQNSKKPYKIKNVYIFSNYRLMANRADTSLENKSYYKGYFIVDPTHYFKPQLFVNTMVFDSGAVYNQRDHNNALSRLINLDVFKFVKNRFEETPSEDADTGRLNVYYYLTHKPKKSLGVELSGSTKSNNYVGSEITATFRNRNAFKMADHLDVYANAGTEVQYGGSQQGFNTYKLGGGVKFVIPRFVIPFISLNTTNAFVPQSIINLSYDVLNRSKLFTLNSLKGELGYTWKPDVLTEHILNPVSVNFVKAKHITQIYLDSIKDDPVLKHAVDTQYILGSNYAYTLNQLIRNPKGTGIYLRALADISGNLAGLLIPADNYGIKKMMGGAFSQYLKGQVDFRYYRALTDDVQWINRALVGIGFPYGNSEQLPYIKQFFAGGNNSLRGFRSRSVGPGTYRSPSADNKNYFADQSGDIKVEFNSEFRFMVNKYIEPAVFLDAGNIWLFNKSASQPGGEFTKNFLNQLAVDGGAGLRINAQILIIRLDVAIPLREPWLGTGSRWVFDQINFDNKAWRQQNIVYNLAIGYPF